MIYKDINNEIKQYIGNGCNLLSVDQPLDTYFDPESKKTTLQYEGSHELLLFVPNDRFDLIVGHLPIEGRNDPNKSSFESWTHEVELICVGSHKYLYPMIEAINAAGAFPRSYNLNSQQIWRRYFDWEQYPENSAFTIRYSHSNPLNEIEINCRPCNESLL